MGEAKKFNVFNFKEGDARNPSHGSRQRQGSELDGLGGMREAVTIDDIIANNKSK